MAATHGLHANSAIMKEQPVIYNELAIRGNMSILDYCRTFMSAISGSAAGILGLTGLYGFIFYFITAFSLSVLKAIICFTLQFMLFLKTGGQWHKYFRMRRPLLTHGLFGGLFTYILFWTFLYGMVHVY